MAARPAAAQRDTATARLGAARLGEPLTRTLAQPGPYYAVQTKHLLLVAIDTGIDGHLDREQWDWLTEVSGGPARRCW